MIVKSHCNKFKSDFDKLILTGNASDCLVDHLAICQNCQKTLQTQVLHNIRALAPKKMRPRV
jgi:hypothetical protein